MICKSVQGIGLQECSRQIFARAFNAISSQNSQCNHLQEYLLQSIFSNVFNAMICKSVQGIGLQECSRQILARAFIAISSQNIPCNHMQEHLLQVIMSNVYNAMICRSVHGKYLPEHSLQSEGR